MGCRTLLVQHLPYRFPPLEAFADCITFDAIVVEHLRDVRRAAVEAFQLTGDGRHEGRRLVPERGASNGPTQRAGDKKHCKCRKDSVAHQKVSLLSRSMITTLSRASAWTLWMAATVLRVGSASLAA